MTTLVLALALTGVPYDLTFVPTGMTKKMGGYMPVRAEMVDVPSTVKKKPEGLTAAHYGAIKIGEKEFGFILDEPDGAPSKLYVDSNGDGDFTNDPATVWAPREGTAMYMGTAQVTVNGQLAGLGVYRFDKSDPNRAQLKNTLLYYTDFGYEGKLDFGSSSYTIAFAGALDANTRIWVDRNGNGKSDGRSESIAVGKPFNFGGTTYVAKVEGGNLVTSVSSETVAEIPLPPDLSVGKLVLNFEAVATNGEKINFPSTFKGKIVMLDFWATWCGPCIAELPNLIKAYNKYHDKGFEVLGISFDQKDMGDKVAAFTKEHEMPWMQVYEGKYWETTLGLKFGVEGIPFCLLVDGDTGLILANVNKLRGEELDKTLQVVLAKRGK